MTTKRRIAARARQDAPGAMTTGEGVATPRPRTTFLQRNLTLALKHAQPTLSLRAIADAVGISESSVSRILAYQVADLKASTKGVMATAILERLDDWAKASRVAATKGYHQPAKDFIEAAGAIELKPALQVAVQPSVSLTMHFGLGALKDYAPGTTIDATPVKELTPTASQAQDAPVVPPRDDRSRVG